MRASDVMVAEPIVAVAGAMASARKATALADLLLKQNQTVDSLNVAASAYDGLATLLYEQGDLQAANIGRERN